ncbi:MAG: RsmE family RNA methyltransferase [bacterium]|nr:RsmE family RNA methyltransferase [bacterium]
MTRRRFYAAAQALDQESFSFAPREAHHIARVLRLRPGARLVVFDGRREAEVEIIEVGPSGVIARRTGPPSVSRRPVEISLIQGIPRGAKMDLVVRMGTEIGLSAIHPVHTDRTVVEPSAVRVDRWRRVAQEAARQCGRGDTPEIHAPARLPEALAALGPVDLFVVPWEHEARPIGEVVAARPFHTAAVLIGPEGGLTEGDLTAARAVGGQAVSLGALVLRTETAGLVATAMLLYERLLRPQT